MLRKHVIFTGRVQGVGFRFRAGQAAQKNGCTGWIMNKKDGSVVMEIQGTEEAIDQVFLFLESFPYFRIDNKIVSSVTVVVGEQGFETKHMGFLR